MASDCAQVDSDRTALLRRDDLIANEMNVVGHLVVLERTGGKETIRVRNIEAQREALALRRLAESELSIEERLEAGREALRGMRRSVTTAYRELRPQPFGESLQEREERRGRTSARAQGQEQSVARDQARERSFVQAQELVQCEGRDLGR